MKFSMEVRSFKDEAKRRWVLYSCWLQERRERSVYKWERVVLGEGFKEIVPCVQEMNSMAHNNGGLIYWNEVMGLNKDHRSRIGRLRSYKD